jgi:hypothetical protein
MLRTTLCKAISLAALVTFSAATPAPAVPPGFERWVAPDSDFYVETDVEVRGESIVPLKEKWLSAGSRPVDLEINWYEPEPDVREFDDGDPLWHRVTVLEVPDDGSVSPSEYWGVSLAWSREDVLAVDHSRTRITDIELYYRDDPWIQPFIDAGKMYDPGKFDTYAVIWESNTGNYHSSWDFIPPTRHLEFIGLLNDISMDWRPTDIEFAMDEEGHLVNTALLARAGSLIPVGDGRQEWINVPTKCISFKPGELPFWYAQGWQLLDAEAAPAGFQQDPIARDLFYDEDVRFGIFVRVPWPFPSTATHVDLFLTPDDVNTPSALLAHPSRPIDIEVDGHHSSCGLGQGGLFCEEGYDLYTEVWLTH